MPRIIGRGRYATETYPEPKAAGGGGAVLQIAQDDTNFRNDPIVLSGGFAIKALNTPIEVSFTDWTPGDVLMVEVYSLCAINPDFGTEIAYQLTPAINVGAGWQTVTPTPGSSLISSSALGAISLESTAAVRLNVAPTVRLLIVNAGSVPNAVSPILLRASRCAGASWVQGPPGVLV